MLTCVIVEGIIICILLYLLYKKSDKNKNSQSPVNVAAPTEAPKKAEEVQAAQLPEQKNEQPSQDMGQKIDNTIQSIDKLIEDKMPENSKKKKPGKKIKWDSW